MSDLPEEVQKEFRAYLGFGPKDEAGGPVRVYSSDDAATIKTKIEDVNDPPVGDSPEGVGRLVLLPAGRLTTDQLVLQQGQSLRGVKGSTILTLKAGATMSDVGENYGAYIKIGDTCLALNGIAGQGVIEDLDIDLIHSGSAGPVDAVHGLFAPQRGPGVDANLHTIRNVAVYNATGDGIHFEGGNDKLVCDRLRSERAVERGMYLAGGDVKARAIGSASFGSALEISGAAVELNQFDLWRPETADGTIPTLKVTGGTNGCVIQSGTVEGKTLFAGKNNSEDADNDFINSRAQFAFVHFKHLQFSDEEEIPDCYLEVNSADLVELISCKFGRSGPDPVEEDDFTPYEYLIKITNTGATINRGLVKIIGGSGLLRYLVRPEQLDFSRPRHEGLGLLTRSSFGRQT